MQLYEPLSYAAENQKFPRSEVPAKTYQLHTWQTDWQQKAKMESESILNMPRPELEGAFMEQS